MLNVKPLISEKFLYTISIAVIACSIILFWIFDLDSNLYYVISIFVISSLSIPIITSLITALFGGISLRLIYAPIVSIMMLAVNYFLTMDLKLFKESGHFFNHFGNADITYFILFALITCALSSVAGIAAHYLIKAITDKNTYAEVKGNKHYSVIALSVYACCLTIITVLYWILGSGVTNFEYCLIFRSFLLCTLIPIFISVTTTIKIGFNREIILLPIVFVAGECLNYACTIVLNAIINKEDIFQFGGTVPSWAIAILSCGFGVALGICIMLLRKTVIKNIKSAD